MAFMMPVEAGKVMELVERGPISTTAASNEGHQATLVSAQVILPGRLVVQLACVAFP